MRAIFRSIRAAARAPVHVTAALIGTLLVGGCDKQRDLETAGSVPMEANKLHPISAEWQRATFAITDAHRAKTWTGPLYFDTTRFVRQYGRNGRGPLDVAMPRGSLASKAGSTNLRALHQIAQAAGIAQNRLNVHERADGASTVTLSYQHIAALAPEHCALWPDPVQRRAEVMPYRSFGCATQRNLANMVADPTDLVVPTAERDRGSDRREVPHKAYTQRPPGLSTP